MHPKPHLRKITNNEPLLRWPGGKRWLVDNHSELFNVTYIRYIEPFCGSASVFFSLKPKTAILSDTNEELIITYKQIQNSWLSVAQLLEYHHQNHSKEYYYKTRESAPHDNTEIAARLIYLNRTCFNGIYRVNTKGRFNVPIGSRSNIFRGYNELEQVSKNLNGVLFEHCDFSESISKSSKGDLLFIDPPYTVMHENNGFIKYNEKIFSWNDQIRLKNCLMEASTRGVNFVITNALHQSVIDLYSDLGRTVTLTRSSCMSASSNNRKICREIVVRNF